MSVFMVLRINAEPQRVKEAISGADWESINRKARENGAIHHRFLAAGNETVVFDEWESAEGFQKFFASATEIPPMMEAAGMQGEPHPEFWQALDTPDQF